MKKIKNKKINDLLFELETAICEIEHSKSIEISIDQALCIYSMSALARKMNISTTKLKKMINDKAKVLLELDINFIGWYEDLR